MIIPSLHSNKKTKVRQLPTVFPLPPAQSSLSFCLEPGPFGFPPQFWLKNAPGFSSPHSPDSLPHFSHSFSFPAHKILCFPAVPHTEWKSDTGLCFPNLLPPGATKTANEEPENPHCGSDCQEGQAHLDGTGEKKNIKEDSAFLSSLN